MAWGGLVWLASYPKQQLLVATLGLNVVRLLGFGFRACQVEGRFVNPKTAYPVGTLGGVACSF